MAHKTWWVSLVGTLALIVITSGCGPPRPWGDEYPGPWQEAASTEDFNAIARALGVNNVRGCGEFHYRRSAYRGTEYLVYCTRDGKVWLAYQVWPFSTWVSGPHPPAVGVPPPY